MVYLLILIIPPTMNKLTLLTFATSIFTFFQAPSFQNVASNNTTISTNFYQNINSFEEDKIWINLSGDNAFSQILIGFLEDATDGVDQKYDGLRLDSGNGASFYSILEGLPYGIQAKSSLKSVEELPLGIKTSLIGNFTISIDHLQGQLNESTILIVDQLLQIEHNIKDSDYTFYIDGSATEYNNRFTLKILSDVVEEDPISEELIVVKNGNELNIKTTNLDVIHGVTIFDIFGNQIGSYSLRPNRRITIALRKYRSNDIIIIKAILATGAILTQKTI